MFLKGYMFVISTITPLLIYNLHFQWQSCLDKINNACAMIFFPSTVVEKVFNANHLYMDES